MIEIIVTIIIFCIIFVILFFGKRIERYFKSKVLNESRNIDHREYESILKIREIFSNKIYELIDICNIINDESIVKKELIQMDGYYFYIFSKENPLASPFVITPLDDKSQMDKERINSRINTIDCAIKYLKVSNHEKIKLNEDHIAEVKRQTDLFHREVLSND